MKAESFTYKITQFTGSKSIQKVSLKTNLKNEAVYFSAPLVYMSENLPHLPHPPLMEHVEDVERFSKYGLVSVETHLQDQQHRRRSIYFALLV